MGDPVDLVVPRTDGVVWRVVGADLVVYETATSVFVQLNRTGRLLWELLVDAPRSTTALAERLAAQFGLDIAQAATDVDRFVEELRSAGLLLGT
jgi:PqqD family protein of HPr-rel-A system